MKKKNLNLNWITNLEISYREQILNGDVTDVTPNGLWIVTACGERTFITRTELDLMRSLVSTFFKL